MNNSLWQGWKVQESLLQSYRLLMAISQLTLLVTAGFMLMHRTETILKILVFFSLAITGLVLLYFFGKLIQARSRDVSWFQLQILNQEENPEEKQLTKVLCAFKTWQKQDNATKLAFLQNLNDGEPSPSRIFLNRYLIWVFALCWIWLSFLVCHLYFNPTT